MTTDQSLTAVKYGEPITTPDTCAFTRRTGYSVETIVERLRKEIEAEGLWVLHEIDPQMMLRRGGFAIEPARQVFFFHPRLLARILSIDPADLIEAPLKFAVIQLPSGEVLVRWFDVAKNFSRYQCGLLDELARELAEICDRIVDRATS